MSQPVVLYAMVDRDGQLARDPIVERPDRLTYTALTDSAFAQKQVERWDADFPSHAPHYVRPLTWATPT
jgi:hypothetical protein